MSQGVGNGDPWAEVVNKQNKVRNRGTGLRPRAYREDSALEEVRNMFLKGKREG